MEEEKEEIGFEIGVEKQLQELKLDEDKQEQQQKLVGDDKVLLFLDSMESYLTLFDSLSSSLRQGWLELASARHSMGASLIKPSIPLCCYVIAIDSIDEQPHFILRKWGSLDCSDNNNSEEDEVQQKSGSPQLRHRNNPQLSEEATTPKQAPLKVDDQVQKERSKSLSIFGTLVSPKLRAAQLSFETALETLVEIANMRSVMLSAYHDEIAKQMMR